MHRNTKQWTHQSQLFTLTDTASQQTSKSLRESAANEAEAYKNINKHGRNTKETKVHSETRQYGRFCNTRARQSHTGSPITKRGSEESNSAFTGSNWFGGLEDNEDNAELKEWVGQDETSPISSRRQIPFLTAAAWKAIRWRRKACKSKDMESNSNLEDSSLFKSSTETKTRREGKRREKSKWSRIETKRSRDSGQCEKEEKNQISSDRLWSNKWSIKTQATYHYWWENAWFPQRLRSWACSCQGSFLSTFHTIPKSHLKDSATHEVKMKQNHFWDWKLVVRLQEEHVDAKYSEQ